MSARSLPRLYNLPSQLTQWSVSDKAMGSVALDTSGFPPSVFGVNSTGVTRTIVKITCYVDAGTDTTFTLVDSLGNNLLGATGACSVAGTSATLSSTTTLANGVYMKDTITPDGTAKLVVIVVSGTIPRT